MKTIVKILSIIFIIFLLIYIIPYYSVQSKKLRNYHINEKIVVSFSKWEQKDWIPIEGKFILDMNTGNYEEYNGDYTHVSEYTKNSEKNYNNTREYYFEERILFNKNGKIVYNTDSLGQKIWTKDGKYLISQEGYIARMFGIYLAKRTAGLLITIIEAETGKSKQLIIYTENGNSLKIDKIFGYVEE